jgi:thiamine biosynthesis lipoprotein
MGRERFVSMGCEIVVGGATPHELDLIRHLFDTRDRRFSRFQPGSELNHVNRAATDVVPLSPAFHRMLLAALRAASLTDGLVDPTLGRGIEAAGYDRDFDELVSRAAPAAEGEPGRWRELRFSGRCLRRSASIRLDLNGVVKGKTVDDALGLVSGQGFVSAGGDLATHAPLDVALPDGAGVSVTGGLASSSSRKRRWQRGGEWQHHLIDPRTGRPSKSPWTDVTVCASTCLDADIAAKAAFLLGGDGPEWLDERGLAGYFLLPTGEPVANRSWRQGVPEPAAAA